MNIAFPRSVILKLAATTVTLLFLLGISALPALAKASQGKEFTVPTPNNPSALAKVAHPHI